ncbi:MAG: GrpB family protein, partial [Actinomycetes bacterium]
DTLATVDRLWTQRLVPFADNLRHYCGAPRSVTPVLVGSDDSWPHQAQRVITRIAALAGRRAHRVDHIGSTSVPGLDAKDVLDVQVVVTDLDGAKRLADDLIGVGLVRLDGRWWDNAMDGAIRDKAMATNADPGRAVNCHIRLADSPVWRETLLLRDWLRAHAEGAREYAALKHRLAARIPEIEAYADAKTQFIRRALDQGEQWATQTSWRMS